MASYHNSRITRSVRRSVESSKHHERVDALAALGDSSAPYTPSADDQRRVADSFRRLQDILAEGKDEIYGIHTGFGKSVKWPRNAEQWQTTQSDLLRGLQVGVGPALPDTVVRRALRLQCMKTALGLSAIHPETFGSLVRLANGESLAPVPRKGSLGASGDLIPMAHAVAPLFAHTPPRGPRDVIGLVNTNAIGAAWAVECLVLVEELLTRIYGAVATASVALSVSDQVFASDGLDTGRVDETYSTAGKAIAALRSEICLKYGQTTCGFETVQPRYSIRCSPQVLGSCEELLEFAARRVSSEATAVADNPIVVPPESETGIGGIRHGGLFYAAGIATGGDALADCVAKLAEMCDRQILNLVDTELNGGLPDGLSTDTYGLKGVHILVSALCQEIRSISVPTRLLSFSAEGNNQDIVPCGMTVLNRVSDGVEALMQIVGAFELVSERALLMRFNLPVPPELELEAWSAQRSGSRV